MGIGSILLGALKRVPWTSLAMNYGPELMKRFGERVHPNASVQEEGEDVLLLMEGKIRDLESTVEEQKSLLAQQQDQLRTLDNACSQLASQVRMYRMISILTSLAVIVLLIILLSR